MGILCGRLICRNAIGRRAPHPEANAPSAALRHGPFPRINSPLAYSPKQPGAALGRLEVDHADHQRASDRVSRIPPTPSSSAREGFGPFDTDHRGWCLVADVGRLLSTPASLATAPTHTVALPAPIADATQEPPYALEMRPRRRRWISVLGNLIFAALCMIIAMFFIFVLGIFGALLYVTS